MQQLSMAQIQWLIHFMRHLPGNTAQKEKPGEYEEYMRAQRDQAQAEAAAEASMMPPPYDPYADGEMGSGFEMEGAGYPGPEWGYPGESW